MWRQAGPLRTDADGIAVKGMMVRHMVLPENLSGSGECLSFLAGRMGPQVWVSLMNQYFPAHKGLSTPPLDRKVTREEYEAAFAAMTELGIFNGFVQECPGLTWTHRMRSSDSISDCCRTKVPGCSADGFGLQPDKSFIPCHCAFGSCSSGLGFVKGDV